MKAVHGHVRQVRKILSQQTAIVEVEIPIEGYKAAVQLVDDADVLVVPGEEMLERGQIPYGVVDSESAAVAQEPAPKKTRTLSQWLVQQNWFFREDVREAVEARGIYTPEKHKAAVEGMECYFRKDSSCTGDVVAHHCRTAANAGTGIKPSDWWILPVCDGHHRAHHDGRLAADKDGRRELAVAAAFLAGDQIRQRVKGWLGWQSMSGMTRGDYAELCRELGVDIAIPGDLRET